MCIICPSCGAELQQITNSHVKAKHPEFQSVTEFKTYFRLDSLWSPETVAAKVTEVTGKSRGKYNMTDKFYDAIKLRTENYSGENHWNYGNVTPGITKDRIGRGVKNSEQFQSSMARWHTDATYRDYRMQIVTNVVIPRNLQTRADKGLIIRFENRDDWAQYKILVYRFTRASLKTHKETIDPTNLLAIPGYQLDHKFSQFAGFHQGVPPHIIGSVVNLEPMLGTDNRAKYTGCSITVEELCRAYYCSA